MSQSKRTTTRTLLTSGATAALLALPLAAVAHGLDTAPLVSSELVPGDAEELATLVDEATAPLADPSAAADESATKSPAPGESQMEPAGESYAPVTEPQPAPAPARAAAAPAPAPAEPVAAQPTEPGNQAPLQRGWLSRTMMAFDPVQSPLFAGPLSVPAPQFADPAALASLATTRDGWAATPSFPVSHRSSTSTPAQWPLPVAAGMLMLVGGAMAVYAYDRRWQSNMLKAPFSTRM